MSKFMNDYHFCQRDYVFVCWFLFICLAVSTVTKIFLEGYACATTLTTRLQTIN